MSRPLGAVAGIRVHPVASLAPVAAAAVEITASGLAGDRTRTVVDAVTGARLRGRTAPGLGSVVPTGDDAADTVTLTTLLGRPVRLETTDEPQVRVAAVHLVSVQALERAARGDVPEGCSPADPRANLLLDLPGDDERDWVGREVSVGGAVLRVTRTPRHCLGVYAEVAAPGPVAVGDAVEPG